MALMAPTIRSMVSTCSENILTDGCLSGATVKVYRNTVDEIGDGVASSSQKWITLNPGVVLAAGDVITATQELAPQTSPQTSEVTTVQSIPANPPAPIYESHLYGCAACTYIGGMVPGAKYTVIGTNEVSGDDEELSTGTTSTGEARPHFIRPLWVGEKLRTSEDACGNASSFAESQAAENYHENTLPAPEVTSPIYECDTNVYARDGVHGAHLFVNVEEAGVIKLQDDQCTTGQANFTINPAIKEDDEVFMWQEFSLANAQDKDDCAQRSNDTEKVKALAVDEVEPPHVIEPLCHEGPSVRLGHLRPGAKVIITHDGVEYEGQVSGTGPQDFNIGQLKGGENVFARMEICGFKTGDSNTVDVNDQPDDLPDPILQDPLFTCTNKVHVSNIHPGAYVTVYSTFVGPIANLYVYDDEADITVAPGLMKDDTIFVVQKGCGLESGKSNVVVVKKADNLALPTIVEPLYDCGEYVSVENVVPGAMVKVYVNGHFAGSSILAQDHGSVHVNDLLQKDDKVKARQLLCDLNSDFGPEAIVQAYIGKWEPKGWYDTSGNPITEDDQIVAIHATLLKTGKVLFFGGDQHISDLNSSGDVDHSRLMDVNTFRMKVVTGLNNPPSDIFCAGHAQTKNGDLLVAGGTEVWRRTGTLIDHSAFNHFIGSRDSWIFNADAEIWERKGLLNTERPDDFIAEHQPNNAGLSVAELTAQADASDPNALIHSTGGKWYPTVIAMADGKLLAVSGHAREEDSRHNNNSLEMYDLNTEAWSLVGTKDCDLIPRTTGRDYEYPRLLVLSDGTVFSAYNMADDDVHKWTVGNDPDDWQKVEDSVPESSIHSGLNGSAILLPFWLENSDTFAYFPDKVLMVGGTNPRLIGPIDAIPNWIQTDDRKLAGKPQRRNLGAVILPTGEIFVEGGVETSTDDGTSVFEAELYDPRKDEWFTLPTANIVRNYHHVALLLPNGSVYVGGSNVDSASGPDNSVFDIEIFKPWYFCRKRPVIENSPDSVRHGNSFNIEISGSNKINSVVIVKCGTTTHNFNCDQRMLELPIRTMESGNKLQVEMTENENIAIIGYYLLFILDGNNVPSEGKFIQVKPKSTCFIATAIYGDDDIETDILRAWRDDIIDTRIGKLFFQCYLKFSPAITDFLNEYSAFKKVIKVVLDRFVAMIRDRRQ